MCDHEKTRIINSRKREQIVYRRRECQICGERFSTYELEIGAPEGGHNWNPLKAIFDRYFANGKQLEVMKAALQEKYQEGIEKGMALGREKTLEEVIDMLEVM